MFIFIHSFFILTIMYLWYTKREMLRNTPIWHKDKHIFTLESSGKETSQLLFDPYSVTHISHGILFYLMFSQFYRSNTSIWISIIVEVLWEMIENTEFIIKQYRKTEKSREYAGDSLVNAISDVWFAVIGVQLMMYLSVKQGLMLVMLIEVVLWYVINDNMMINVLQVFGLSK